MPDTTQPDNASGVALHENPEKPVVLIGLMGSGKSSIGRRLAARLGLSFADADEEVEKAAGCSIEDFFERFGEAAFRDGERKVIARLMADHTGVLATGGGAFVDPQTRKLVLENGISVWLRAELEVLLERVKRRRHRPLLRTGDPRKILKDLMEQRYPVYQEADIIIESSDESHDLVVNMIIHQLRRFAGQRENLGEGAAARNPEESSPRP